MSADGYSREEVFAGAVRREREARNWTQTDLAREMKGRGFPFHQQTIQRIEDGQRAVRLDEAYAIAEILGKRVEEMTWDKNAMRQNAAWKAVWVGVPTNTVVDPVMTEFLDEISLLEAIVEGILELEVLGATDTSYVGLELIRRGLARTDAIVEKFYDEAEPFIEAARALGQVPDEEEQEAAVDEDYRWPAEKRIRELLAKYEPEIPAAIAKMSLAELASAFAGEDNG